jgi:hypothetical protein
MSTINESLNKAAKPRPSRLKATWDLVGLGLTIWIWGGIAYAFARAVHASPHWQFAWFYIVSTIFVSIFCTGDEERSGDGYCNSIDSTEGRMKAIREWWIFLLAPLVLPSMIVMRVVEACEVWMT